MTTDKRNGEKRMKKIINFKYFILLTSIAIVSLFMVFYVYINYAYEMYNRYKNIDTSTYLGDMSKEEIEEIKSRNIFQDFLSLKEGFSVDMSYSKYCQIKTRIIPIVIISVFFLYTNIKRNLIKYNIGRNDKYINENNKLKRKIALIPAIFSLIVVGILTIIGLLSTKNNFLTYFKFLYNHNDLISFFMFNNIMVFIVFEVISFIGIYLLCLFSLEIVDRYGNTDGIIIFIIMSWVLPIITSSNLNLLVEIRRLLPHSILLIGTEHGCSFIDLILPMVILVILILWIRKLDYDKIEI